MSDKFTHLDLNIVPQDFLRKKRQHPGYKEVSRNRSDFYATEVAALEGLATDYMKKKEEFKEYLDPELIFKIKLNQKVSDDVFRREVERAEVEIIRSTPQVKDYWVAFTEDAEFRKFKEKLSSYAHKGKQNFFNAIEDMGHIPPEDKIGERLKSIPFRDNTKSYLDVEIWRRMDIDKLRQFLDGFRTMVQENGGEITDELLTNNFCLLRIISDKKLYEKMLQLNGVAKIDRPPEFRIDRGVNIDLQELKIAGPPPDGAAGILVIDSGILHHPLLEPAIGEEIAAQGPSIHDRPQDDVGHGTGVAGIALYGDIGECINQKQFKPDVWIHSAKVLYRDSNGNASCKPGKLFEHQLKDAVESVIPKHENCKIVNLSFSVTGETMNAGERQFNTACLLDELSRSHNIIFVVCTGNNDLERSRENDYPHYLISNSNDIKLLNPSSSALSLTVGALRRFNGMNHDFDLPSPITRIGPGLDGMLKPEFVEYGGGTMRDQDSLIFTLNPAWVTEGRLFGKGSGTSLSAPKIANYLAKLVNAYPNASTNLIKALLLSSASIPMEKPEPVNHLNDEVLHNIYGYGKPNIEKALYSEKSRVLLVSDTEVRLNHVRLFNINLPLDFVKEKGHRKIGVTLSFDPPVNKNRSSYLGVTLEARLFKNQPIEFVERVFRQLKTDEEDVPNEIKRSEIKLSPGVNIRKKGVHQHCVIEFSKRPHIDVDEPLVLAVVCRDKGWIKEENFEQPFAVVVTFEHSSEIDLYNQLKVRNLQRARIR